MLTKAYGKLLGNFIICFSILVGFSLIYASPSRPYRNDFSNVVGGAFTRLAQSDASALLEALPFVLPNWTARSQNACRVAVPLRSCNVIASVSATTAAATVAQTAALNAALMLLLDDDDPPTISSITPSTGVAGTTVVTIVGSNFSSIASEDLITFYGASPVAASSVATLANGDMQLTVTVPISTPPGQGNVIVTVNEQAATSPGPFTVQPPCTGLSVSPTSLGYSASGGSQSVAVTAPSGCSWSVSNNSNTWMSSGVTGSTGSATVTLTASANASSSRNGTITISGNGGSVPVTVSQAAAPCIGLSASPASLNYSSGASSQAVTVTAPSGCSWSLSNSNSWLSSNIASGSGNAAISLSATAYTGATARSGTVTISGLGGSAQVSVTQTSAPSITAFSPASGPIGTVITISGSGFSNVAASNTVWVGYTQAYVETANSTSLTVTVLSDATTGPVQVSANGSAAVNAQGDFTVSDNPAAPVCIAP